jgi:hypothetical protein
VATGSQRPAMACTAASTTTSGVLQRWLARSAVILITRFIGTNYVMWYPYDPADADVQYRWQLVF